MASGLRFWLAATGLEFKAFKAADELNRLTIASDVTGCWQRVLCEGTRYLGRGIPPFFLGTRPTRWWVAVSKGAGERKCIARLGRRSIASIPLQRGASGD